MNLTPGDIIWPMWPSPFGAPQAATPFRPMSRGAKAIALRSVAERKRRREAVKQAEVDAFMERLRGHQEGGY